MDTTNHVLLNYKKEIKLEKQRSGEAVNPMPRAVKKMIFAYLAVLFAIAATFALKEDLPTEIARVLVSVVAIGYSVLLIFTAMIMKQKWLPDVEFFSTVNKQLDIISSVLKEVNVITREQAEHLLQMCEASNNRKRRVMENALEAIKTVVIVSAISMAISYFSVLIGDGTQLIIVVLAFISGALVILLGVIALMFIQAVLETVYGSVFVMDRLIQDLRLKLLYWDGVTAKAMTKTKRKQQ